MKIRIKGNSLRYRLTRTEVEQFSTKGHIEETIDFGNSQLIYALKLSKGGELSANFKDNTITMHMPENIAKEWTGTDRVGFESNDGKIYLLVEKDFKCLDNVAEDQSDNYPNPLANK
jgi:hypothetical protein